MRKIKQTRYAAVFAGLLGAAMLMGSPLKSDADPGKWWGGGKGQGNGRGRAQVERRQESRGGGQRQWSRQDGGQRQWSRQDVRVERRVVSDSRQPVRSYTRGYSGPAVTRYRGDAPVYRTSYRAPVWGGSRQFTGSRYYRSYGSIPVYRDYVGVRVHSGYRPVYGWRYYCAPTYYYPTHVVYVRPVRFFVAADFAIGGVGISASYADPGPVYGCNFCDARFGDYAAYERHVEHCPYAPQGYRVMAEEWDRDYSSDWQDDRTYDDPGDQRYEEYQREYDDDLDR